MYKLHADYSYYFLGGGDKPKAKPSKRRKKSPSGLVWFLPSGVVILDTAPLRGAVYYRLVIIVVSKSVFFHAVMVKSRIDSPRRDKSVVYSSAKRSCV